MGRGGREERRCRTSYRSMVSEFHSTKASGEFTNDALLSSSKSSAWRPTTSRSIEFLPLDWRTGDPRNPNFGFHKGYDQFEFAVVECTHVRPDMRPFLFFIFIFWPFLNFAICTVKKNKEFSRKNSL